MNLTQKKQKLLDCFRTMDGALVAFSGGVDSTLVLAAARSVLGARVLAATGQSPSLAARELRLAKDLAGQLGVRHEIIATREMDTPQYPQNPLNRCYFCKSELYSRLQALARGHQLSHIVNGTNRDDLGDYRPGLEAARESGISSPLVEAGLGKQDVRDLAREMGLPNWDKPAMPCLSSRIPYNEEITPEKLSMVEQAEDFLLQLGFRQLRVRHLGDRARIEVPREDLPKLMADNLARKVEGRLKEIGFLSVTIDPEGFRSGNLNPSAEQL